MTEFERGPLVDARQSQLESLRFLLVFLYPPFAISRNRINHRTKRRVGQVPLADRAIAVRNRMAVGHHGIITVTRQPPVAFAPVHVAGEPENVPDKSITITNGDALKYTIV